MGETGGLQRDSYQYNIADPFLGTKSSSRMDVSSPEGIFTVTNFLTSLSNREETGKYEREQQPLLKKLRLLLLFNPLTEWIDSTHLMRLYIHNKSIKAGMRSVVLEGGNH